MVSLCHHRGVGDRPLLSLCQWALSPSTASAAYVLGTGRVAITGPVQWHHTSIIPQPTGGAPSLALTPWPCVPQIHPPKHMHPQTQQAQGLQIPLASSTGRRGAALCLLLLGRGREPGRQ